MSQRQQERSKQRLTYELNQQAHAQDRLKKLQPGTPAYIKCAQSIKRRADLIEDVRKRAEVPPTDLTPRRIMRRRSDRLDASIRQAMSEAATTSAQQMLQAWASTTEQLVNGILQAVLNERQQQQGA